MIEFEPTTSMKKKIFFWSNPCKIDNIYNLIWDMWDFVGNIMAKIMTS